VHWRSRHRDREPPAETAGAIAPARPVDNEFDAYLSGVYAGWLVRNERSVPAWARLNPIAHGTLGELQSIAETGGAPDVAGVAWRPVCAFLAHEVLAVAGDAAALASLQQRALVPLELRLAASWRAPVAPAELAGMALEAFIRNG
jgi:hypothetical protein